MDDSFYSKATGKLRQSSHNAYSSRHHSKKDQSSVYSLEDEERDHSQYPMGTLSPTQFKYIELFMKAITSRDNIEINPNIRSIHWVGLWSSDHNTTVSCSIIQPHMTNMNVTLSGVSVFSVQNHATIFAQENSIDAPKISKTTKYCQAMGMYSVPFVDYLIENGFIHSNRVSWSMNVLSMTQPIFTIVNENTAYECKLTHTSCRVMEECHPETTTMSPPTTGSRNFAFRSSKLRAGSGTGPTVTVHTAGTIQYQGKPESIYIVVSAFKDCIDTVMDSHLSTKFLRSLAIIRKIGVQ